MKSIHLVLPNQLFQDIDTKIKNSIVYLIEEQLFFTHFAFHKQKLLLHRVTMKKYQDYLEKKGFLVKYIEATTTNSDIRILLLELIQEGAKEFTMFDPSDDWIERRVAKTLSKSKSTIRYFQSPMWINTKQDLTSFFQPTKKKYFQTQFYISERKKLNILVENQDQPVGGQWSYDADNRKRYPKGKLPPVFPEILPDKAFVEAKVYVQNHFPENPGYLNNVTLFATDFQSAKSYLVNFFEKRFAQFGTYEDAILSNHNTLNHSVLSPMLNCGLLTPNDVITEAVKYAEKYDIPLNSLEGFIRQIIGWREFIRGVYLAKGRDERTLNFWKFKRKIPSSFYTGTTGIEPVDNAIKKALETGYNHHIERLMILGNFMLLCEFDPDEVYKWFMEMYIDSYDWVMVPNVYGMSQFADGGLMSTKPYLSGSNYILKMSDYKKGEWQKTWDGLFWVFISNHKDYFIKNPRLSMMVRLWDKMPIEKKQEHLLNADLFIGKL